MIHFRFLALAAVLAVTTGGTTAQVQTPPLPVISPEAAGFSSERLRRIDDFFAREIELNRVAGAVVGIARNGQLLHFKAYGWADKTRGVRASTDNIFQLASMTKIMVAAGALSLTEEGRLPLQSKLSDYFPAVASMQVGTAGLEGKISLQAQARPILIHDLMRHTSGLTYGGRPDGGSAVSALHPSGGAATQMGSAAQLVGALAVLPLVFQPGTVFEYSLSYDVLGAVLEKITGKTLGAHLGEVLFKPLNMPDTGFQVASDKRGRLAHPLPINPIDGKPQRIFGFDNPARFDCGGSCAWGTVGDYLRFGQMLLNGGSLDGKQVLSPQTVRLMTSNHLGPELQNRVANVEPHRAGYGYGLGVAVRLQPGLAAVPGNVGEYSWNGANGTGFFCDPKEQLVVVFGTAAPGEIRKYYREQVQDLVYGAMTR